ncbi:hypothetical protein GUJ93_ZPchr0001g30843 [Zizania palustris]|uniref:Probable zinc-ribbon domain-containing protein n=1 Tax=Zizania palustris TaxID=103762 RepID=A0A8J5RK10_ZIZPA|nr:hypothetical protein GUJ93_ZPchr0001g30843 [Zizania palustris]
MSMESEQVKRRFGRCPYCRAMIYQDPKAVIYYCSKCRTPIRGKSPEPTDDAEYALAQLEILSADTASVFSDEPETPHRAPSVAYGGGGEHAEQPPVRTSSAPYAGFDRGSREIGASSLPYRGFNSVRTGSRSGALDRSEQSGDERSGSPMHNRVGDLRPSSRRTRRPMNSDMDAPRDDGSSYGSDNDVPTSAASYRRRASPLSSQELEAPTSAASYRRWASPLSSQELEVPSSAASYRRRASPLNSQELEASSMGSSGYEPSGATRSRLTDPAFQKDLMQALGNLRKVIATVEQTCGVDEHREASMHPKSASCNDSGGTYAVTRRNSRLMRRLESQLVQALPQDLRRDASTSSTSSASSSLRGGERRRARKDHCRPILGGTPFVVCDKCSGILQLPGALSVDRTARLQCGACDEVLSLTLPASGSANRPKKIFSAPQPTRYGGEDHEEEYAHARRNLSAEQRRPAEGPLHRMLGYSSVSSVLRSRRYGEHN